MDDETRAQLEEVVITPEEFLEISERVSSYVEGNDDPDMYMALADDACRLHDFCVLLLRGAGFEVEVADGDAEGYS